MSGNRFVFILGAGASAESGAPLMNGFLQQAEIVQGEFNIIADLDLIADFDLVRQGRAALQRVHSKAKFDIHNLESVFAAFEMAALMEELPGLTRPQVKKLVLAMARVITATLEQSMTFEVFDQIIQPHPSYHQFSWLVKRLLERKDSVAILTFNYDIGLEAGLSAAGLKPFYVVDEERAPAKDEIELLKLHGSLNWASCAKRKHIQPWSIADIVNDLQQHWVRTGHRPDQTRLVVTTRLQKLQHCEANCKAEPVIVPPTSNKAGFHRELRPVWKRAARRLREADHVFVLGYSWPKGDHFFQQLYALGTASERILRRFSVYDIDVVVRERFRKDLLGEQAAACFGPVPFPGEDEMRFSNASVEIARTLKLDLPSPPKRPSKPAKPQIMIFGGRGSSEDWMK